MPARLYAWEQQLSVAATSRKLARTARRRSLASRRPWPGNAVSAFLNMVSSHYHDSQKLLFTAVVFHLTRGQCYYHIMMMLKKRSLARPAGSSRMYSLSGRKCRNPWNRFAPSNHNHVEKELPPGQCSENFRPICIDNLAKELIE